MKLSEDIQARMLLRRTLLELHNGCSMSSWFHMADFAHYAGDKHTCGETWMVPDPNAEGIFHFKTLPVSTAPPLMTDRSVIEVV
jgi:hypothetical protein